MRQAKMKELKEKYNMTATEILRRFPPSGKRVKKKMIKNSRFEITFDAEIAQNFRRRGRKIIIWGGIYDDRFVFVFASNHKHYGMPFM